MMTKNLIAKKKHDLFVCNLDKCFPVLYTLQWQQKASSSSDSYVAVFTMEIRTCDCVYSQNDDEQRDVQI